MTVRSLLLLSSVPAVLLTLGGVAVFLTEDDDPVRLLATIGGGLAMSLALIALVVGAGRAAARGPRRRAGAARDGSPAAWAFLVVVSAGVLAAGVFLASNPHATEDRAGIVLLVGAGVAMLLGSLVGLRRRLPGSAPTGDD